MTNQCVLISRLIRTNFLELFSYSFSCESKNSAFTALDNITVVDRTADDLGSANLGFEDLSQIFSSDEQVGPRILEPLSEVIDSGLRAHISEESMKLLWDKYPRPENCKNLIVPRFNNELWPKLSKSVRPEITFHY